MSKAKVEEWLAVIKIATDSDSPFMGMVDLTPIFQEPLAIQHEIFDALSDEQKAQMKSLYGPKSEDEDEDEDEGHALLMRKLHNNRKEDDE